MPRDIISNVLVAGFIALIIIGVGYELNNVKNLRRQGERPRETTRRLRRRLFGMLFLSISVALLVNVTVYEKSIHNPMIRLIMIGMSFVSVFLAMWMAVKEVADIGRMAKEESERALQESVDSLQQEVERVRAKAKAKSGAKPGSSSEASVSSGPSSAVGKSSKVKCKPPTE